MKDPQNGGYYLHDNALNTVAAKVCGYACQDDALQAMGESALTHKAQTIVNKVLRNSIRAELNKLIKVALVNNFRDVTNAQGTRLYNADGSLNPEVAMEMADNAGYRQSGSQPYGMDAYRGLLVKAVLKESYEPSSNVPSAVIDYLPAAHLAYVECVVEYILRNPTTDKIGKIENYYSMRLNQVLGRHSTHVTLPTIPATPQQPVHGSQATGTPPTQ